jgi:hypothetical protein
MSDMIERAAKAIMDVNANTRGMSFHELSRAMARAVIEVLRDPTFAMKFAGRDYLDNVGIDDATLGEVEFAYRAMIDSALSQDTHSLPLKPQEAVNAGIGAPHSSDAGTNSDEAQP